MRRQLLVFLTIISVLYTICACSKTEGNIKTPTSEVPYISGFSAQAYNTSTNERAGDVSLVVPSELPLTSDIPPSLPSDSSNIPDSLSITPPSSITTEPTVVPIPEPSGGRSDDIVSDDYYFAINSDGTITLTQYVGKEDYVIIPSEVDGKSVTAIGNVFREEGAFMNCDTIKQVIIPMGVTVVEDNAFQSCANLLSVTIPSSVTLLRNCAFDDCPNLRSVYFQGDAPQIANYVFSGTNPDLIIYYREGTSGWTDNPWSYFSTLMY